MLYANIYVYSLQYRLNSSIIKNLENIKNIVLKYTPRRLHIGADATKAGATVRRDALKCYSHRL